MRNVRSVIQSLIDYGSRNRRNGQTTGVILGMQANPASIFVVAEERQKNSLIQDLSGDGPMTLKGHEVLTLNDIKSKGLTGKVGGPMYLDGFALQTLLIEIDWFINELTILRAKSDEKAFECGRQLETLERDHRRVLDALKERTTQLEAAKAEINRLNTEL